MKTLGQFCSISRSLDVLGERWSLLVIREVLLGSCRFGEIGRDRCKQLLEARVDVGHGFQLCRILPGVPLSIAGETIGVVDGRIPAGNNERLRTVEIEDLTVA